MVRPRQQDRPDGSRAASALVLGSRGALAYAQLGGDLLDLPPRLRLDRDPMGSAMGLRARLRLARDQHLADARRRRRRLHPSHEVGDLPREVDEREEAARPRSGAGTCRCARGPVRSPIAPSPEKDPAQDLHDQPERGALVERPSARSPPAAGRRRPPRRSPAGPPDRWPSRPAGLLAVPLHAHFPRATMLVAMSTEMRDAAARPRHRDGEGIRGETTLQAAMGHHGVRRRGVGQTQPDESALGGHLRVVGEAGRCGSSCRDPDGGEAELCEALSSATSVARRATTCPRPRSPSTMAVVGRLREGHASPGAGASRPCGSSRRTAAPRMTRGNRGPGGWPRTRSRATHWASSSGTPRAAKIRVASVCSWSAAMGSTSGGLLAARGDSPLHETADRDTTGLEAGRSASRAGSGGLGLDPRNASPYRANDGAPGFPEAFWFRSSDRDVPTPCRAGARARAGPCRHARAAPDSIASPHTTWIAAGPPARWSAADTDRRARSRSSSTRPGP